MTLYDPFGVNPKTGDIRKKLHKFYQGDTIILKIAAETSQGEPVTLDNCDAKFTLVDKRFSTDSIWEGDFASGITVPKAGVLQIKIPDSISQNLRRGSFMYALTITDRPVIVRRLIEEGTILIEFGADAPNINLAYKSVTSEEDSTQNMD